MMKKKKLTKEQIQKVGADAAAFWKSLGAEIQDKYYLDVFFKKIGQSPNCHDILMEAVLNAFVDKEGYINGTI